MNMQPQQQARRAIRQAAELWIVRMQDTPDEDTRAGFVEWLCTSPVHVAEYLHAEAAWQAMADAAAAREDDIDALCAAAREQADDGRVVDFLATMDRRSDQAAPALQAQSRMPPQGKRRRALWAAAATVLIGVGAATAWLLQPVPGQVYTTAIGEIRRIPLEDGSVLELNTDSAVIVRFHEQRRDILLQRGEAFISVDHDSARPLRVIANGVGVRAVGTAFNVRRQAEGLQVTVTEGRVALREVVPAQTRLRQLLSGANEKPLAGTPQGRDELVAGQQLQLSLQSRQVVAAQLQPADTARWLGWRSRELEFDNERLDAVVAELNRYNRQKIVLEDAALAGRRISGGFDPSAPETLLRFLQMHGDVQVATGSKGELRVSRSAVAGAKSGKNNRQ